MLDFHKRSHLLQKFVLRENETEKLSGQSNGVCRTVKSHLLISLLMLRELK